MGNITKLIGREFTPPVEKVFNTPEIQLADEMRSHGITPPDRIILDGTLRRFASGTKGKGGHGDKTGWYIGFDTGIPAAKFGCWRLGVEVNFRADIGRTLTVAEEMANARRMSEAKTLRDAEMARDKARTANVVEQIWVDGGLATEGHPYLERKGIGLHGTRITGDGRLMLPLFNAEGHLSSIQYISPNGDKQYHLGGGTSECFWTLGEVSETIYIAEGFATAATIFEHTGQHTVVAYSASNLVPVTRIFREKYGATQHIVIVADNDASGVGQKYADQASAKYGATVIMPPELGDANDYVANGGDLSQLLSPLSLEEDWLVQADEFSTVPSPISWQIKNWVQDNSLMMIHGQSGGGKTFVVLDWCMHIASGLPDWAGHKVKKGAVVYLAGEGHAGLRGRVAAWKKRHKVNKMDMWVSKSGCDLNTHEGLHQVCSQIRALEVKPSLVIVDTLHRFLNGDENSAQDTKGMLDACAKIIQEFNCSVGIVHHTGVSSDNQHRARGSSAWKGALEIEVSVLPASNGVPMQIIQRKSKDTELADTIYCNLETVDLDGWFDDDGEVVTSAVIEIVDAPISDKKDSKLSEFKKLFKRAWFFNKCEILDGNPYVSRSGLMEFLIENDGINSRTAENKLKPSTEGGFINILLNSEVIIKNAHGWSVSEGVFASSLVLESKG